MIDTHCHLDSPQFDPDRAEVLERAWRAGVEQIIAPSVGPESWPKLLELSRFEPRILAGLGIHPQLLPELDERDDDAKLAALESLLASGAGAAVGECGLDGPCAERAPLARQLRVFEAQLTLAERFDKPVIIHCLRAHDALLALFERRPPRRAVLHSFSGSAEQVRRYLRFDVWFSFAGPITYESARKPATAARAVPPERLLVETDAPDQTPRPFGGRCEPAHVARVVEALAAALGLTPAEVAGRTAANARVVFSSRDP